MATLALRREALSSSRALEVAPLVIGTLGLVLGWAGAGWDVAWHRLIGRDTFWSPPHLGMYAGTALSGIAALLATATRVGGRPARTAELRVGPLHVERSLALVGIGALTIISAAPLDELWHRLLGRDIDIWSPPHLLGVAGAVLVYAGWSAAAAAGVFPLSWPLRQAMAVFFLAGLAAAFVFGMNFYYVMGWSREALLYPLVACALLPLPLAMSSALLGHRWSATVVAAGYTLLALVTFGALRAFGWPPPAFPPLVLAGALAVDLVRARGLGAFAVGAAFAVALVVGEGARLVLFPPPPPSAASLADPQAGGLVLFYAAQAATRPWLSAWPLLAIAAGAPLAALSWRLGTVVARALAAR